MTRWFALFALPLVVFALAACGGGDDDDDDDDGGGSPFGDSSGDDDDGRTDSSGGSGSLTIAGKEYKLDMETCELGKKEELTVFAASIVGEDDADFSASGIGNLVAIGARIGQTGYISVGQELDIDGKSVKWEGDLINPADPGKQVKGKFDFKC